MDGPHKDKPQQPKPDSFPTERFIETTFEKLSADSKVLIGLFAALNSVSGLSEGFDLSEKLWEIVRFNGCGPMAGQSEEVNWLKGVCDGILLLADYS